MKVLIVDNVTKEKLAVQRLNNTKQTDHISQ
jgi:hypothetical protein